MIISKTDLLEVKKDYLDKVMIRDGSEESKALNHCTLDVIEEELANEFIKEIARKTIIGFSCEIFITFFSGKGTC